MSSPGLRYYCIQCDRDFSRKEHLQRHQTKPMCSEDTNKLISLQAMETAIRTARVAEIRLRQAEDYEHLLLVTNVPQRKLDATARSPAINLTVEAPKGDADVTDFDPDCTYQWISTTSMQDTQCIQQRSSQLWLHLINPTSLFVSHGDDNIYSSNETDSSSHTNLAVEATTAFHRERAGETINLGDNLLLDSQSMAPAFMQPILDLNAFDQNMQFSWDESALSFHTPSPYWGEGFPHFLWRADGGPTPPTMARQAPTAMAKQAPTPREVEAMQVSTRGGANATSSTNPFANCPFVYQFKQGPTVDARKICEFLHDEASWQRATLSNKAWVVQTTEVSLPRVKGAVRDAIAARVHGMLFRLLDRTNFGKIPHLFPPLETIQSLFAAYQRSFAGLYPMIHPTTFLETSWNKENPYEDIGLFLTSIMILGGLVTPVEQVRSFSSEMGYLLRVILNEDAGQDESRLTDQWVAGSVVLLEMFSAWSGIKRQMELAEAFHGIFSSFFLRRGFYGAYPPYNREDHDKLFHSWTAWIDNERALRLCQVWYVMEHEISLLYGVQPSISFTKIRCPMPVSEELFMIDKESKWRALVDEWAKEGQPTTKLHPPSLATFRSLFLHHDFLHMELSVTPFQLRLLLCTIQAQVAEYSQTNRFTASDPRFMSLDSQSVSHDFVQVRQQEELENMLVKWTILAERVFEAEPYSELRVTCFLVAQLVWMELYMCFDDVQLIAGKEGYRTGKLYLPQLRQWARSASARKAIAHAGQISKVLQSSGDNLLRPVWWPVAVSRMALVIWCYNIGLYLGTGRTAGLNEDILRRSPIISLNDPDKDHGPYGRLLQPGEGIPCLQDAQGTLIPLHRVDEIFGLCLQILDKPPGLNTPLLESIRQFIQDIGKGGIPYTMFGEPVTR